MEWMLLEPWEPNAKETHEWATKFQKSGSIKYNQFMSGVDRQDQMLAYYTCEHKTMRWYKIVGIHILQMMMLNIYCLYQKKNVMRLEKM